MILYQFTHLTYPDDSFIVQASCPAEANAAFILYLAKYYPTEILTDFGVRVYVKMVSGIYRLVAETEPNTHV